MTEKNTPENPWHSQQEDGRRNPPTKRNDKSGNGSGNNHGDIPPDIDEIIALFSKKFKGSRPGSGLFGSAMSVIAVITVLWFASGLYRILPEEQGVVLRFGALNRTISNPGLGYHLPWPIETLITENVTFERRMTVGFTKDSRGNSRDIPEESLMLTGDANIIDIDLTVQWKIGSLSDYLFKLRDPENSLKKVSESAIREVVGQNLLQLIITEKRAAVSDAAQKLIQTVLDGYGSGIVVTQVLIEDATVPPPVMDAFEDVVRASQDAETAVNKAHEYRNDIVPRARGQAIEITQNSQAYKEKAVNTAKGEAGRFDELFKAYNENKDVTRNRLYLETMENVIKKGKTVIVDRKSGAILPYLSLDKLNEKKEPVSSDNDNRTYR